jgi:sec-independent protein translocase protein TatB
MFGIGSGEFLTLVILAFILIGPDRMPTVARDIARFINKARAMANSATAELRENLGPGFEDLDVTDLHPKKLIKRTIGLEESTFSLDKPEKQEEPKRKAQIDPDLL